MDILVEKPWSPAAHLSESRYSHPMAAESLQQETKAIELNVEYQQMNAFFADYARNISRGGSFIATATPLGIGTEFRFSLHVPQLAEPLRFHGTVMWVTVEAEASPGNPAGMGIEIRPLDEAGHQKQRHDIEALMYDELGPQLTARLLGL